MSDAFRFSEEERESLCDLAWREFTEEPFADEEQIADEQQIERFIVKIEEAINEYPSYCNMPGAAENRRKLKAARKTVEKLFKQLLSPGHTLKFLKDSVSYMTTDALMPPNSGELEQSLGKIGVLIDFQLELLRDRRVSTVRLAIDRFTAILVCRYFFEYEEWPAITDRKKPKSGKEHPLQSPFVHFLDHALQALVEQGHLDYQDLPQDTKHLTRKTVMTVQRFFEAMLNERASNERM